MPTESRSFWSEKSYSPSRLMCPHEMREWLAAAARKRGRRGGRPPVLDKEGIRVAEAMLKDTMNYPFVGDVIDRLGIGRTAFYRYFPPDRIRELRNQA
jgi:DNA invertase Pin-like site-specific DNA recombinase